MTGLDREHTDNTYLPGVATTRRVNDAAGRLDEALAYCRAAAVPGEYADVLGSMLWALDAATTVLADSELRTGP